MKNKLLLNLSFIFIMLMTFAMFGISSKTYAAITCGSCGGTNLSYKYSYNTSTHTVSRQCASCNASDIVSSGVAHTFSLFTKLNDTQHTAACVCGYSKTVDHSISTYTAISATQCTAKCKGCGYTSTKNHNFSSGVCTYCGISSGAVVQSSKTDYEYYTIKNPSSSSALNVNITMVGVNASSTGRKIQFLDQIPAGTTRTYIRYVEVDTSAAKNDFQLFYIDKGATTGYCIAWVSESSASSPGTGGGTLSDKTFTLKVPADRTTPTSAWTSLSSSSTTASFTRDIKSSSPYRYFAVDSSYRDFFYRGYRGTDTSSISRVTALSSVTSTTAVYPSTDTTVYSKGFVSVSFTCSHSFTTTYSQAAATHTATSKCSSCGTTKTSAAENHSWDTSHKCTICGYQGSHSTSTSTTAATCTTAGAKTTTCACGYQKIEDIAALGHSWGTSYSSANATQHYTQKCSRCSATQSLANHTWNTSHKCTACNYQGTHSYTSKVTTAATCTAAGVRTYTCTCTASYTESITKDANNHSGTASVTTYSKNNADVHNVVVTYSCCGVVYSSTTAAHTWNAGTVTTAATCTSTGVKTYTCTTTGCGQTKTETINKNASNHSSTATTRSYPQNNSTTHYVVDKYNCCGAEKDRTTANHADTDVNGKCDSCGYSMVETPTVTLSSASGSVNYNSTNNFTVTATVAGKISVSSGSTSYVTITEGNGASLSANTPSRVTYKGVTGTSSAVTITVVFTPTNTAKYNSVTKTYSVTAVNKITNTLSVSGYTVTYNKNAQTLVSASNAQGPVYYAVGTQLTSSNYSSSGNQTVPTRTNADTYTVYYYTPGNTNYAAASGSVTAKINKATPTLSASNVSVKVGSSINATYTYTGDGTVSAKSGATETATVGTVNNTNKTVPVNGITTGSTTITLTATSGTNYNSAEASFQVTVTDANVSITDQPDDAYVKQGNAASFTVVASGTNLEYQWYKATSSTASGTAISGAENATYTIAAASVTKNLNGTYYYCNVKNTTGTVSSNRVLLTVYYEPTITSHPANQEVIVRDPATFSVSVTDGNPNDTTYQWQQSIDGGSNWTNISNATSPSYTISETAMSMDGYKYRVVVGNSKYSSAATSNVATLRIGATNYSVDGIFYQTLEDAYEAIASKGSSGTIKVETSNTDTSTFTVEEGKTITIDTSDKTITKSTTSITVDAKGTLTIIGNGTITSTTLTQLITNNGTLNIASGTLTLNSNSTDATAAIRGETATGKVNISGTAKIIGNNSGTGNGHAVWTDAGTVEMTGGSIEAETHGIFANNTTNVSVSGSAVIDAGSSAISLGSGGNANAEITGGTLTGDAYAILNNGTGKVTLGNDEGSVNTLIPSISGGTHGVYNTKSGATFEFYDGILKGSTAGIGASTGVTVETKTPTDYAVGSGTEESYKTAFLKPIPALSALDTSFNIGETINITYTYEGDGVVEAISSAEGTVSVTNIDRTNKAITLRGVAVGNATITLNAAEGTTYAKTLSTFKVTITDTPVGIITNPSDVIVKEGNKVSFSVVAEGSNLTYQWYKSTSSPNSETAISGANNSIYEIPAASVTKDLNETYYFCKVKNSVEEETSATAKLTVYYAPMITKQPTNQEILYFENATFTVETTVGNPAELTYQWQQSTDGGNTWTDISGATQPTYTTASVTEEIVDYRYRVQISNKEYTVASNEVNVVITFSNYSVNGSYYLTLAKAYSAVTGTSGTIIVEASNEDTSEFRVRSGKTITLDTNSNVVTRNGSSYVEENATLNIIGDGEITSNVQNTIVNEGTLNVTDAKITNTKDTLSAISNSGKCTINSGTISGTYIGIENIGELTVAGGMVQATGDANGILDVANTRGIAAQSGSKTTITGGTIKATNESEHYGARAILTDGNVYISGGTIEATSKKIAAAIQHGSKVVGEGNEIVIQGNPTIRGVSTNGNGYGISITTENEVKSLYNITVSGGKIEGSFVGLFEYLNTGKILITGGEITGDSYGISTKDSEVLTLGVKDGNVSTTTPSIFGKVTGIIPSEGKINFYDGVLIGKDSHTASVLATEDGYGVGSGTETIDGEEYTKAYLKEIPPLTVVDATLRAELTSEVSYNYGGDGKVTATSSNKNIFVVESVDEVNKKVIIKGIAHGTATLTITAEEGEVYAKTEATSQIVIKEPAKAPTAPKITVKADGEEKVSALWINKDVTIEIGGSTLEGDGTIKYQYSYDNLTWTDYTAVIDYSSEVDEITIYAKAYNDIDEKKTAISTFVLKIDKTVPKINELTVTGTGGSRTVTIKASDDFSGINGYLLTTSEEEPTVWTNVVATKESTPAIEVVKNGTYYLWLKDQAGNITKSQEIKIIDIVRGDELVTTWEIPAANTEIKLPIPSSTVNNYTVYWGDGLSDSYTTQPFPAHTYSAAGEYTIIIEGSIDSFGYYRVNVPLSTGVYGDYYTFTQYIKGIVNWGEVNARRFGFASCTNLQGQIPEARGFTNLISTENMFYGCTGLTSMVPNGFLDGALKVKSVKGMFMNCTNINVAIPANLFANNSQITNFENVFANCSGLNGQISESLFANNKLVTSFAGAFKGCSNLSGVIPGTLFANNTQVISFKETFANCSRLQSPAIEAGETLNQALPVNLFASNRSVMNYYRTFYNCTGLTGSVSQDLFATNSAISELSKDDTINSNYRATFEGCTGIKEVRTSTMVIGHEMFKGCTSLANVVLENTIDIGNEAFYGCNSLTQIEVTGDYLNTIGTDAFEYTGSNPAKLFTSINKDNDKLESYEWDSDNRIIDVDAPKGTIRVDVISYPFTNEREVKLKITITDSSSDPANCQMAIINEDTYNNGIDEDSLPWQAYQENVDWTLTNGDGAKTVYVFFKDEFGNIDLEHRDVR